MFIFRKEKALSDSLCDSFIQTFETCPDHYKHPGVVSSDRKGIHENENVKTSTDITFNPTHLFLTQDGIGVLKNVFLAETTNVPCRW